MWKCKRITRPSIEKTVEGKTQFSQQDDYPAFQNIKEYRAVSVLQTNKTGRQESPFCFYKKKNASSCPM